MSVVGTVDSVWRYPVKSMGGEEPPEIYVGCAGVYGDRLFAFRSAAAPAGFPYLTGRERPEMLTWRPRFREPAKAALPPNLAEAIALAPNLNPVFADPRDLALEIVTPGGERLAIDDPALLRSLGAVAGDVTLVRSERALTDCRPVSLFALQTARQLGDEVGSVLDKRRFRANVYMDLAPATGFSEDAFVGRRLRIGPTVVIAVLERDARCKMITLDPDSGEASPEILRRVAQAHDGMAGVYGAVLAEGKIRPGDPIDLLA